MMHRRPAVSIDAEDADIDKGIIIVSRIINSWGCFFGNYY
jgi:hypothetical protein